jgi:hypothetical protein
MIHEAWRDLFAVVGAPSQLQDFVRHVQTFSPLDRTEVIRRLVHQVELRRQIELQAVRARPHDFNVQIIGFRNRSGSNYFQSEEPTSCIRVHHERAPRRPARVRSAGLMAVRAGDGLSSRSCSSPDQGIQG